MVKYISFNLSQLRQKFQHERNLSLAGIGKNKFYTSKVKILIYDILVFSLLESFISHDFTSFTM